MNPSASGRTDITGLLQQLTGEREQKYGQGLQTLQRVAEMMAGPEFDKYAESMYETAKKKTVGAGIQNLISSGLMGTERAMQPGMQFEREVGTPFRLGLAEQKTGRIAGALGRVADYIQAGTPSAGTLSYLATGGFGALSPQEKMAMQQFPYLMQAASQREQANIGLDAFGRPMSGTIQGAGGGGGSWGQGLGGGGRLSSSSFAGAGAGAGTGAGGYIGAPSRYGTSESGYAGGIAAQPIYGALGETEYYTPPEKQQTAALFPEGAGGQFGAGVGGSWEEPSSTINVNKAPSDPAMYQQYYNWFWEGVAEGKSPTTKQFYKEFGYI